MITAPKAEPYYPRDDQPLVAFRVTHDEMLRRFGPAHRLMDSADNEPGPTEYWAYRFSASLSVLLTFHFTFPGGSSVEVTATEPEIDRIIESLDIANAIFWRVDRDCADFFAKRYPDRSPQIKDARPAFEEAVKSFRRFAAENGKPLDFIWISRDRVIVSAGRVWIFRPDETQGDSQAERFYELKRASNSSIKLSGIATFKSRYLTCVEEMSDPLHRPRQFYLSLQESQYKIREINNFILWSLVRLIPPICKRDKHIRESLALERTMIFVTNSGV